MDAVLEKAVPQKEAQDRVETPDGKSVYLFRYDNPQATNKYPNSEVSHELLVGRWFTDSLAGLAHAIFVRSTGGRILIAQAPKDKLEELKAANHPIAQTMDIEPIDNYILTDDLLKNVQIIPVEVAGNGNNKYLLSDMPAINKFVNTIVPKLQAQAA